MDTRASVSQRVNADDHGNQFTRPLGAAQPPKYRHGPCSDCGAPVTVSAGETGPLTCWECESRRVPVFGVLMVLVLVVVAAVALWAGAQ